MTRSRLTITIEDARKLHGGCSKNLRFIVILVNKSNDFTHETLERRLLIECRIVVTDRDSVDHDYGEYNYTI